MALPPETGDADRSDQHDNGDDQEGFAAYSLLSTEERNDLSEALAAALPNAGPDFGAAIRDLVENASGPEPFELMGAMTFYLASHESGTNPEFNRPLDVYQHHLEVAQAVLFRNGISEGVALPPSRYIEDFTSAVKVYKAAWTRLQLQKVQRARTDQDRHREMLMFDLRLHASTNRGWGYTSRMEAMLQGLLEPLSYLRDDLGLEPAQLPVWWRAMRELGQERFQHHRVAVSEALDWPVTDEWPHWVTDRFGARHELESERLLTTVRLSGEARHGYIINRSDFCLHQIYRFTLDDLIRAWPGDIEPDLVRALVSMWAMSPGEDGGVTVDRLPTENPVVGRPFISCGDDTWYLFCGWLTLHNPFELIERTFEGYSHVAAAYRDRRTEYLEQRLAELLGDSLPGATVERAVVSVDPTDGKEYENDVLALISSFAVVAEAKSGGVHPDARNKPTVLRDRISDLVVEPSEQALRLADRLASSEDKIEFRRRPDGSTFVVDAGQVRRTLTLGVTLEPIADLLPRLSEIADSGFAAAADALSYNINLLDLEVVVDLLDHPSEVLHYLARRAEIERHTFLHGDEIDLLALYLETGFNLGEEEFRGKYRLSVTGMSDPIDVWHYRLEAGMDADKPRPHWTEWWERVLTRLEDREMPRWAEIGVTMCNVGRSEQQRLEDSMQELHRAVVTGERPPTDFLAFLNGPPQRRDLFVGVIVTSADAEERRAQCLSALADAVAATDSERAILLAWTPAPSNDSFFALAAYDAESV